MKYMAVCDSRVLLGGGGRNTLYKFALSAKHTLRDAGSVTLQSSFHGVACTRRNGVTLVAFSHDTSVSLLRLTSLPLGLEPLASVSLTGSLMFREDLLIFVVIRTHDIVSFRVPNNALTERRVLLDTLAGFHVNAWALMGDRLVFWNFVSDELLVYVFTWAICERASRRNRSPLLNSLGAASPRCPILLLINYQNPQQSALFNEFSNSRIFVQYDDVINLFLLHTIRSNFLLAAHNKQWQYLLLFEH